MSRAPKITLVETKEVAKHLKNGWNLSSEREACKRLGLSGPQIANWMSGEGQILSSLKVANVIRKSVGEEQRSVAESQKYDIRPVVEFFPIEKADSPNANTSHLFPTSNKHPKKYRDLKDSLSKGSGIYIFYDSGGNALYVGKAERQDLWQEMTQTFNRKFNKSGIFRVGGRKSIPMSSLAAYFSAYSVSPPLIRSVEALLTHAFANDLSLNTQRAKFPGSGK